MGRKIIVSSRKRARAKKASVSGEGRRVGRLENEMFRPVDKRLFRAGVATPENKDEMFARVAEIFYHGFGERFPTLAAVRAGEMCLDG